SQPHGFCLRAHAASAGCAISLGCAAIASNPLGLESFAELHPFHLQAFAFGFELKELEAEPESLEMEWMVRCEALICFEVGGYRVPPHDIAQRRPRLRGYAWRLSTRPSAPQC